MHLENNPSKYKYLLTSDGQEPASVDDEPDLDSTIVRNLFIAHADYVLILFQKAMETVGFSSEDMISVFELLAAILNLGNIDFEAYSLPDGTSACNLSNSEGLL